MAENKMTTKPPIYYISEREIEIIARAMAIERGINPDALVSECIPLTINVFMTPYIVPQGVFPAWRLFITEVRIATEEIGKLINIKFEARKKYE